MQQEEHLKTFIHCTEDSKKERHIVSWSQEEDDILREQISIHGTDNWAIIASKFKGKTTRQCRRRWYTYLNCDFKKGGWSPEEDMLLCEAQKIFGNRWTEIAKVVSGRTDNAVKNRFSTLCKKRAKSESLGKENDASRVNQNNKRCIVQSGSKSDAMSPSAELLKKIRRTHIPASTKNCNYGEKLHSPNTTTTMNKEPRSPLAVLTQSSCNAKEIIHYEAAESKIRGTFLKKDDPKVSALMQQAELLSSLAEKVNTENTDQSFENAWKVLQEFLNRSKEGDIFRYKISDTESIDLQFDDLKDLVEDLRNTNEGSQQSWRQSDRSEESPCSSEYSTGSTLLQHTTGDNREPILAEIDALKQKTGSGFPAILAEKTSDGVCDNNGVFSGATINQDTSNNGVTSALSFNEFGSPLQVTPIFRSLAAGIPSPKFSESERNFLLRTLGVESPSSNPSINASKPPACKRALLTSL